MLVCAKMFRPILWAGWRRNGFDEAFSSRMLCFDSSHEWLRPTTTKSPISTPSGPRITAADAANNSVSPMIWAFMIKSATNARAFNMAFRPANDRLVNEAGNIATRTKSSAATTEIAPARVKGEARCPKTLTKKGN